MRRTLTRALVPVVAAGMIGGTLAVGTANAFPAPVTEVETFVDADTFLAVNTKFNYADSRNIGIPALKQLRGEMWDINPMYNGVRLQDAARAEGLSTRDAYMNAVKSDAALTRSAVQRAVEQTYKFGHERPTNQTCRLAQVDDCRSPFRATYQGYSIDGGENAATGGLRSAILEGWGHGELSALNHWQGYRSQPNTTPVNGHLHELLDPTKRAYGFGTVTTPQGQFSVSLASRYQRVADNLPDQNQHVWMYRAADFNEKPTGIRTDEPPEFGLTGSLDMGSLDGMTGSLDTMSGEGGIDLGSLTGGAGGAGGSTDLGNLANLQNIVFLGLAAATLAAQFGMIPPLPIGIQFG